MNAPYFALLSTGASLAVALIIGFFFGFFLERAGFSSARKLTDQFYFRDFSVLKVMFTAIIVAMLGIAYLALIGWLDMSQLYVPPTFVWPQVVGGLLLGAGFTLVGYEVAPNASAADGALWLALYWHLDGAAKPPAVAYTVFLHLTDDQGVLVTEPADSPPVSGDWPTTAWLPGTTITDTHLLALPPNLGPGRYDVRLGLYDAATGERLPAFRPDGTRWAEDTVVLEGLVTR